MILSSNFTDELQLFRRRLQVVSLLGFDVLRAQYRYEGHDSLADILVGIPVLQP